MDLVPSEFRRWGLCTACCEDMACWAPFGALVSAWLNLSRQYSSAHHQNRDTGGQLLKWWWDASLRQVLTVSGCRAAPMTPAQVEMQTEQVQFEEPALPAEQMSANQAGALYIVFAVLRALAGTLVLMEGRRLCTCMQSWASCRICGRACVGQCCCPDHMLACCMHMQLAAIQTSSQAPAACVWLDIQQPFHACSAGLSGSACHPHSAHLLAAPMYTQTQFVRKQLSSQSSKVRLGSSVPSPACRLPPGTI